LTMPVEYEPQLKPDDYRCFVVDWTEESTRYITGMNMVPGNPAIVHHVIAFHVPPSLVDPAIEKEESEDGPGYTCFGAPGINDSSLGQPGGVQWLGSWAPGGQGVNFPEGTGIIVQPDSKVILQVHYNTYEGETQTDRSTVQFSVEDSVDTVAHYLPWTNPSWVFSPSLMSIPAGDAEVVHSFGMDLASVAGMSFRIYSANLHMHMLGSRARTWIRRSDGDDCLLEIPRWDFNWQHEFLLEEPKLLAAGDELWLECEWDNSADNQPVIQGEQIEPRDVGWGDGTTDEMCLAIFYVTVE
jgi:hypothetical protein